MDEGVVSQKHQLLIRIARQQIMLAQGAIVGRALHRHIEEVHAGAADETGHKHVVGMIIHCCGESTGCNRSSLSRLPTLVTDQISFYVLNDIWYGLR
jgi:hypothetical protein